MKKDKFVPMKIYFDYNSFELAERQAEEKINILEKAYNWCREHIDISKLDKHEFVKDIVVEFINQLEIQKSGIVNTKLSTDKLMFLLDINIVELKELKNKFERIKGIVNIVNSEWRIEVFKDNYTRYTKNQEENDKLICGNNLIKALEMVGKYKKVYPHNISMGTSQFVQFDMRQNKYEVNMSDI
jgi:hypothetical protein